MLSNRLAFAVLGVACIAAAAGGGYFATRQNAVPVQTSAAGAPAPAAATPTAPGATPQPIQATDASVDNTAAKQTPAALPAPGTPAKSSRDKTPARSPEPSAARAPRASGQMARRNAAPPDGTWPNDAAAQAPVAQAVPLPAMAGAPAPDATATGADDRASQDPEPQKTFEELVVPADSVIGLQTETSISSEHARVEDSVDGRVTRDVRVNGRVAIPAGTRAIGTVTLVERGGKFKERARLGIRFNTLVLADGTRQPISTETIYREGEAPTSAPKVGGGAVGGAILGAILGGGKGAVIGGMAGAGAGSAAVMAGDRNAAVLPVGATMTVRVLAPVTVTIDK
jgi:type IV secretory pathway VirB10-like protein